jgi:glutamate/aspartate transport system permease protein
MNYHWNWGVFFQQTPEGAEYYWELLASGLGWTLAVTASAWLLALAVGSLVGVLRTLPSQGAAAAGYAYVELFRNVPLLVQMFLWYFVVPELVPALKDWIFEVDPSTVQFAAAVACLGLFTAARVAEQVRAGIQSLPRGQMLAASALGLSVSQRYRHVLLPQAFRIIVPTLTNELMGLIKNSSVALTIGLAELTFRTRELGEFTFQYFEAFTAATLIYIGVSLAAYGVMARIERGTALPGTHR